MPQGAGDTRCHWAMSPTQRPRLYALELGLHPQHGPSCPWGQPGWGGGPARPHALLARLIPALGAVMSRRPGAWRGLDSHLQPPGPGARVLFLASAVHTCGFSQQGRITLDRGGEGLGTGSRWWARPGSRSCGLRTRSWTGLGGPLPASSQPASQAHGRPGLLTFRSSLEISSRGSAASAGVKTSCQCRTIRDRPLIREDPSEQLGP